MNLFFRLFYLIIFSQFRSPVPPLGPCRTPFRCWPTDLDVLKHMNNGIYFSIMDLARVDMMNRSGLIKTIRQQGWYPVVQAETAKFRKSIEAFAHFEVETQVIGWDTKAVLLRHRFYCGETLHCESIIRARFLKKTGGSVLTADLLEAIGRKNDLSPQMPDWIKAWNQSQN